MSSFSVKSNYNGENMMENHLTTTKAAIVAVVGSSASTIGIMTIIRDATSVFSLVASFCGAVAGVWGIVQIIQHKKGRKK